MTTATEIRLAEPLAAVSLATDLGTGQPMGHALRTCWLATGVAREIGVPVTDLVDTYYVALLRFLGCTAEASLDAELNGGNDIALYSGLAPSFMGSASESVGWMLRHLAEGAPPGTRARSLARVLVDPKGTERAIRAHCEVGQMLARRLGLGDSVLHALGHAFERWDGKGFPNGIGGEDIPISCRIAITARDFELLNRMMGPERATEVLTKRKGKSYEPRVVEAVLEHGFRLLGELEDESLWDAVLDAEPGPHLTFDVARLDEVLTTLGRFADLKSPYLHGHSSGVAELAEGAARGGGDHGEDAVRLRHAGLVHDLGRVAVPSGIWNKRGPLSDEQWEQVRLHPYYTQRILVRCGPLKDLAEAASAHHERLDGSGYHRAVGAQALSRESQLLAVADVYRAMLEDRPHRPALRAESAADELNRACADGALDVHCVRAVLEAAGQPENAKRSSWPAGLTDREVDVLRLLAAGLANKQIAAALTLSPKTIGRHVEHIYAKLGVSTRAGATLAAIERGLRP